MPVGISAAVMTNSTGSYGLRTRVSWYHCEMAVFFAQYCRTIGTGPRKGLTGSRGSKISTKFSGAWCAARARVASFFVLPTRKQLKNDQRHVPIVSTSVSHSVTLLLWFYITLVWSFLKLVYRNCCLLNSRAGNVKKGRRNVLINEDVIVETFDNQLISFTSYERKGRSITWSSTFFLYSAYFSANI